MTQSPHDPRLHPKKSETLPIGTDQIFDDSTTDFDLFIEMGQDLTLYAKAPYHWTAEEKLRLIAAGHKVLFHHTSDQARALAYLAVHQVKLPDPQLEPQRRVVSLTDVAAELTRVLYQHPLTPASLAKVRTIGEGMVQCIQEDPGCIVALGKLAKHDDYTYYHSARVAAYALAIAVELSQRDEKQLVEMATGALLHDIGKSRIDLMVLNKPGMLTPGEWEMMKKHPEFGGELVALTSLTYASRQIVVSHHERFDGSGYPHHLTEHELLEEVKIVSFADTFDALTTNRPYQVSRSAFEALDLIKHKLLKNLHRDSYHALVRLIAQGATTKVAK